MGENSNIQWTTHTFNIVIGCLKISGACDSCYAADSYVVKVLEGQKGHRLWGPAKTTERHILSDGYWKKPLTWNRAAEKAGERARVFCSSLADVFEDHPTVESQRQRLWPLIEATPWLDWQLLTKRPENILRMIPETWRKGLPRNVWVGTTVESQRRAEERIPHLLKVPAVVRFLSMEPLLESVDLDCGRCDTHDRNFVVDGPEGEFCNECAADDYSGELTHGHWLDDIDEDTGLPMNGPGINWVIVGGESGSRARPFDLAWVRGILQQCSSPGVPVFVKQLGAHAVDSACLSAGGLPAPYPDGTRTAAGHPPRILLKDSHGGDWSEWPADLRVREMPEVNRG